MMSHIPYTSSRERWQRRGLVVPGCSNPNMFAQALAAPEDYVFVNLEDGGSPVIGGILL